MEHAAGLGMKVNLTTNGTLLNSQELHGEAELHPGDTIRIGDTELTFEVS